MCGAFWLSYLCDKTLFLCSGVMVLSVALMLFFSESVLFAFTNLFIDLLINENFVLCERN